MGLFDLFKKKPEPPKRMDGAQRRNYMVAHAKTKDDDYGYSPLNPIIESDLPSAKDFLDQLYTQEGKKITYEYLDNYIEDYGDMRELVDIFKILVDGTEFTKFYICTYGRSLGIAPKGFKLISNE